VDQPAPADDVAVRKLADGREFLIPKVFYTSAELEDALVEAGFAAPTLGETARFFLYGSATVSGPDRAA
jgi:hypothetical protein